MNKYYYVKTKRQIDLTNRVSEYQYFVDKQSMEDYVEFFKEVIEDKIINIYVCCGECDVKKGRIVPREKMLYNDLITEDIDDNDDE